MATKFVDLAVTTETGDAVATGRQDGSALELTKDVRVIFNDELESGALSVLLKRAARVILQTRSPDRVDSNL